MISSGVGANTGHGYRSVYIGKDFYSAARNVSLAVTRVTLPALSKQYIEGRDGDATVRCIYLGTDLRVRVECGLYLVPYAP